MTPTFALLATLVIGLVALGCGLRELCQRLRATGDLFQWWE